MLAKRGPILVYGEAGSGKTLTTLLAAQILYRKEVVDDIIVVATEPQNVLPAATRHLPPTSSVYIVYSTFDLLEALLRIASRKTQKTLIIVDSLTSPFRLDISYSLEESIRSLTLAAAILHILARKKTIVFATSQVHGKDDDIEPVARSIIDAYFPVKLQTRRRDPRERLIMDENGHIIMRLVLRDEPEILCIEPQSLLQFMHPR